MPNVLGVYYKISECFDHALHRHMVSPVPKEKAQESPTYLSMKINSDRLLFEDVHYLTM